MACPWNQLASEDKSPVLLFSVYLKHWTPTVLAETGELGMFGPLRNLTGQTSQSNECCGDINEMLYEQKQQGRGSISRKAH